MALFGVLWCGTLKQRLTDLENSPSVSHRCTYFKKSQFIRRPSYICQTAH
jgi:hypothetical protein